MFGSLRLVLALMVMVGHLFWFSDFGRYAVFGFFVLSGYLMTLVMHRTYAYSIRGVIGFAFNRFLRLYPSYWVATIISVIVVYYVGEVATTKLSPALALPKSIEAVWVNITMVSLSLFPNSVPRLSPATWALTVELFYYAIIALGVSRTKNRTLVWLVVSLVYVIATYALGFNWKARYFAIPAGSLPFSIGALLFFLKEGDVDCHTIFWLKNHTKVLFFAMFGNAVIGALIQARGFLLAAEVLFYLNLVLTSLLIYGLINGGVLVRCTLKCDKWLGDFSYPVYLLHWQLCALVIFLMQNSMTPLKHQALPGWWLLITLTVLAVSWMVIKLVDEPIEAVRGRVRARSSAG